MLYSPFFSDLGCETGDYSSLYNKSRANKTETTSFVGCGSVLDNGRYCVLRARPVVRGEDVLTR